MTGLILAKLDGDARGGAALSITSITGVPIKFIGTGERVDALEEFHPDRLASRILGMGDMLTLIEKTQATFSQEQAVEMEKKIRQATFDLEDFLGQLQQLKQMGPLSQIMEMIPGMSALKGRVSAEELGDNQLKKAEAIVFSMTPQERHRPEIVSGSRRRRIARGSGTTPQDVNQLLNQFRQMAEAASKDGIGQRPPTDGADDEPAGRQPIRALRPNYYGIFILHVRVRWPVEGPPYHVRTPNLKTLNLPHVRRLLGPSTPPRTDGGISCSVAGELGTLSPVAGSSAASGSSPLYVRFA